MSVQVENLEHNMAKLTIEVAAEKLEKALDSAYQKQKKQISVPGFRKGTGVCLLHKNVCDIRRCS